MHPIGMNAIHITAGAFAPTARVTNPSDAAMLYAGAVDATPTIVAEARPRAPSFRPLLSTAPPVCAWLVICPPVDEMRPARRERWQVNHRNTRANLGVRVSFK